MFYLFGFLFCFFSFGPKAGDAQVIATPCLRLLACGEEPHPVRGEPASAKYNGSRGENLDNLHFQGVTRTVPRG